MLICCAGEVMIEMAATGQSGLFRRSVAGDTFNTAVYLARAGHKVTYLTRLGDEPLSDDILQAIRAENIATDLVMRQTGATPGLYMISNDSDGERHFSYWRDHAPARALFNEPLRLAGLSHFYLSGITLAVTRSGFDNLLALLQTLRKQGCRIVFDPNYRPALWDNQDQAQDHYRAVLPLCDIALPTLDDERVLWGLDSHTQCAALYRDAGVAEIVIKGDALITHVITNDTNASWQADQVAATDTTGAGDAFNGAYLAARLDGADIASAVAGAQQLARSVVQHRGAILPPGATASTAFATDSAGG
jgi:2-dehydro-3-deoxygluconokinase